VRTAIVSDIHGNLEALQAVLTDIESQQCDRIVCLGDIVGYGPNPCECLDIVSRLGPCVLGNHDYGALIDPEGFSTAAEQAIFWTRKQLECNAQPVEAQRRLEFLARLPRTLCEGNILFVHGSVRNPLNEYVFPEDVFNRRKMEKLFSMIQGYTFQGHTHAPGVFSTNMQFARPDEFDYKLSLPDDKAMINVGSVGQPRDGDWRSCYLILDFPKIEYRRVEYDIDTTVNKIFAIDELDNFLGERLREGR
jgi:diadenosine tetraphosphatase ApaH/serine/threonine PP2A family protein phosphatase